MHLLTERPAIGTEVLVSGKSARWPRLVVGRRGMVTDHMPNTDFVRVTFDALGQEFGPWAGLVEVTEHGGELYAVQRHLGGSFTLTPLPTLPQPLPGEIWQAPDDGPYYLIAKVGITLASGPARLLAIHLSSGLRYSDEETVGPGFTFAYPSIEAAAEAGIFALS